MASGFLDKERIIAGPGFNRWLVPPAALAIHLCIGMAYGFSVFWLPLSKALGIKESIKCGPEVGFFQELFVSDCDWKISTLGWMFTLAIVILGGLGNITGATLGGFILAFVEELGAGYISSGYRDAMGFLIIIAVLLFKPTGLFARRHIA